MLLESHYLCPWSHLVAILAKNSETSRLTNKGTAEPRQVLGVFADLSSPTQNRTKQGQATRLEGVARKQLLVQQCSFVDYFNLLAACSSVVVALQSLFCWVLPGFFLLQKPCARSGKKKKDIADGVRVDHEVRDAQVSSFIFTASSKCGFRWIVPDQRGTASRDTSRSTPLSRFTFPYLQLQHGYETVYQKLRAGMA